MEEYLGQGMFATTIDKTIDPHRTFTPQKVRDLILNGWLSSGPGLDPRVMPTQRELDDLLAMSQEAITAGRFIDFGHWPNDQIKQCSARAGKLYNQSALGHPFSQPYLFMHSWSDSAIMGRITGNPAETATSLYLVNPIPEKGETCISFEACVLECLTLHGRTTLCICDRVMFHGGMSRSKNEFFADIIPYADRWKPDPVFYQHFVDQMIPVGSTVQRMAAANVLDPLMMALMILNTRGVEQEVVTPSPKLNKTRVKNGKVPIPPYRKVNSSYYITALQHRNVKKPSQGGTHASPEMHIRMGHWRRLDEARRTFIQDTIVNATAEQRASFKSARSHYAVKTT